LPGTTLELTQTLAKSGKGKAYAPGVEQGIKKRQYMKIRSVEETAMGSSAQAIGRTKTMRRFALAAAVLAILTVAQQQIRASLTPYTFTFDDEYYIAATTRPTTSVAQWNQAVFGVSQGGSASIYQATATTGTSASDISHLATTTVTSLNSSGSGVPGEFVENTTHNASEALSLNGFHQSLNSGQQVADVFSLTGHPYFQYLTPLSGSTSIAYITPGSGGTVTPFTFNSFDLLGSGTVTVTGVDSSGHQVGSAQLALTSNFQTFIENWQNVITVSFSEDVTMDNVKLNYAVAAVPEPSTVIAGALLLLPFGASSIRVLRKRRAV
jgi:hypothetical protein